MGLPPLVYARGWPVPAGGAAPVTGWVVGKVGHSRSSQVCLRRFVPRARERWPHGLDAGGDLGEVTQAPAEVLEEVESVSYKTFIKLP